MPPNPTALRISRSTGRSYHEVRRALNRLIYIGEWTPTQATEFVEKGARSGADVEALADAALASNQDKSST